MSTNEQPTPTKSSKLKFMIMAVAVLAAGILYWQFGDHLSLQSLAERETDLRAFQSEHPVLSYLESLF